MITVTIKNVNKNENGIYVGRSEQGHEVWFQNGKKSLAMTKTTIDCTWKFVHSDTIEAILRFDNNLYNYENNTSYNKSYK